ncbi:MAG: hypothetical protein HKO82_12560 [Acidimicrobiia bacterium]|nr:hypothetical protein [Acidimicrobiia bacterium]NNJ47962.1 hypothetical protein [Acidimicrobiia bacterium]NNL14504.1 hypothetical protein [Acidimicrobiia bacterium]
MASAFISVLASIGLAALLLGGGESPIADQATDLTWSLVPFDEAAFGGQGDDAILDVTTGGPGLVAVGTANEDAAVWTSPDGTTWTRVPHDPGVFGRAGTQVIEGVTAGGPGFVAVGFSFDDPEFPGLMAAIWTSPDGVTWTAVPRDETAFDVGSSWMHDVTAGGPGLVAVGSDRLGAAVWTSPDGINWTRVPHDEATFGVQGESRIEINSVTVGGPGLVAVGFAGPSPTWINGEFIEPPAESWHNAAVWTSPDGLTWNRVPHDEAVLGGVGNQIMNSVVAGGPGLVAVGLDEPDAVSAMGGIRAAVWTSTDGLSWTRIIHDAAVFGGVAGDERSMDAVANYRGGLVAVGGSVWTSSDGISWDRHVDEPALFGDLLDPTINGVTAGGPGLVAVGSDEVDSTQWGPLRDGAVWIARPQS